jgi:hypothetical protein
LFLFVVSAAILCLAPCATNTVGSSAACHIRATPPHKCSSGRRTYEAEAGKQTRFTYCQILFEIENDVVIGGITVLHRGATATGLVTQAESSKTMGRAGRLNFTIDDIKLANGSKVPVRAFNRTKGENRTGEMIGDMLAVPMVAAPFFLLIHGTNTIFPRGTEITAFVNGDIHLDLSSFDGSELPDHSK